MMQQIIEEPENCFELNDPLWSSKNYQLEISYDSNKKKFMPKNYLEEICTKSDNGIRIYFLRVACTNTQKISFAKIFFIDPNIDEFMHITAQREARFCMLMNNILDLNIYPIIKTYDYFFYKTPNENTVILFMENGDETLKSLY